MKSDENDMEMKHLKIKFSAGSRSGNLDDNLMQLRIRIRIIGRERRRMERESERRGGFTVRVWGGDLVAPDAESASRGSLAADREDGIITTDLSTDPGGILGARNGGCRWKGRRIAKGLEISNAAV